MTSPDDLAPDRDALDATEIHIASPAVVSPPSFCPVCGSRWDPAFAACQACAGRALIPPATPDAPAAAPTLRSALVLYFLIIGATLAAAVASGAGLVDGASAIIGFEIVTSGLVLLWLLSAPASFAALRNPPSVAALVVGVLLSGMTFGVAYVYVNVLLALVEIPSLVYSEEFLAAGYGWGGVVLFFCVQPAIAEELAFRGLLQDAFRRVLQPRDAVIVTAILFMIMHFSVVSFPVHFLLGVVLGVLRVQTGSLYPGMVLHFCHNGWCMLAEALER